MLAIGILMLGIFSRLLVHLPNFTPVIALALFSGVYLKRSYAVTVPVLLMILSDLIIGWHDTIPYTWGSMVLISVMGVWLRSQRGVTRVALVGTVASVVFFAVTNFGAWLSLYPLTWEGFVTCYIAAIPFFRNELISTLLYSWLLFWAYDAVALRVKNPRLAAVLLWR